jgi:hypothetical protein
LALISVPAELAADRTPFHFLRHKQALSDPKLPETDDRWSIAVAIDFGTTGTLLAITFREVFGRGAAQLLKGVFTIKPGEIADEISGDKQPTVLLVDEAAPHVLKAFGSAALKAFGNATDKQKEVARINPAEAAKIKPGLFFKNFKMSLYSGDQSRLDEMRVEPSTEFAVDIASAVAAGAGSSGAGGVPSPSDRSVPALTLVQRTLEYCKAQALEYLTSRMRDAAKTTIKWVLTCPAIWTDEAKGLMRTAAYKAGLVPHEHSDNLMIVLEPEAAILASLSDCAPGALAEDSSSPSDVGGRSSLFKAGTTVLVADCGGGTVDFTVEQVVKAADPGPLALKELVPSSGGNWGATNVDKSFSNFVRDLLGNDLYNMLDTSAILSLMNSFESRKLTIDGESDNEHEIQVDMRDVIDSLDQNVDGGFVVSQLEVLVDSFNTKYRAHYEEQRRLQLQVGFGSASASAAAGAAGGKGGMDVDGDSDEEDWLVSLNRKNRRLKISPVVTRSFFARSVCDIVGHTAHLLRDKIPGGKVDVVLLAGGYSQSPMLQRAMKRAFENEHTAVILPRRPGQAVVLGAALFALMPSAITQRVMKYSWGFLTQETYNPAFHEEFHKRRQGGRDVVNVLLPAVQKGMVVDVGHKFIKVLNPSRAKQKKLNFYLYRVDDTIHDPFEVDKRTVIVKHKSYGATFVHPDTKEVSEEEKAAAIAIKIGGRGLPVEQRAVELEIHFGESEITAKARSLVRNKERKLEIRYGAPGTAHGAPFGSLAPTAGMEEDEEEYYDDSEEEEEGDGDADGGAERMQALALAERR